MHWVAWLIATGYFGLASRTSAQKLNSSTSLNATSCPATYFQLSYVALTLLLYTNFAYRDDPYQDFFISTCNFAGTVVTTTPLSDSNLTVISPRMVVAFPAGNSGLVAYFAPENGINGTLSFRVVNDSSYGLPYPISPMPTNPTAGVNGTFGLTGVVEFNSSANLVLAILGSVRSVRDFAEGTSVLNPIVQNATETRMLSDGRMEIHRRWLDNVTTMDLTFGSVNGTNMTLSNSTILFPAGRYAFNASFNYTQLPQLSPSSVLNAASVNQSASVYAQDLSFLSYSSKILAGSWRFLTYFGRDSMIAMMLLQDKLSATAIEGGIGAVLDRMNMTGSLTHEETIGDYATLTNLEMNITSTQPSLDFKMIDTDFYLQPLMVQYFLQNPLSKNRSQSFLAQHAVTDFNNSAYSYLQLALRNAKLVLDITAPFAAKGNQTKDNLIHLREGQIVGQWRDSTYGIGGGRIPFDVNTALAPAALRAISRLAQAGIYNESSWIHQANQQAQVWEDMTLQFFEISISSSNASSLLQNYKMQSNFSGPVNNNSAEVMYHAIALDGYNNQSQVKVMNSDDGFRHYMLNTTNQTQLTRFVNQTANNIQAVFPNGLKTDVGMIIANPAYGGDQDYAQNWTTGAYHGTVVWSFQQVLMAAGLQRQLARCQNSTNVPDFCSDPSVYLNVKAAYNSLWEGILSRPNQIRNEVFSWIYDNGTFNYAPLAALPAPDGGSQTESDVVQLWSLAGNFSQTQQLF